MPLGLTVGSMNETRTSPRYHWLDNHMFLVLPPEDISLSRGRWSTEIVLSEFVTSVQELLIDRMHIHVFLLMKNKDYSVSKCYTDRCLLGGIEMLIESFHLSAHTFRFHLQQN